MDDEIDDFHEAADGRIAAESVEAIQDLEKTAALVAEDINIRSKLEAEKEEPFTFVLPPSAVEDDPVNQITMVSCTDEQQSRLVYVLVEVSQQADPSSRTEHSMEMKGDDSRDEAASLELPDSFVAPGASSMTPMQVTCQRPPGRDDDTFRTVSRNAYKQDLYVQEFGVSISNRLANVEARTLPFPRLKYHDSSWEECIPSIGQRNMMHKKVVHGGSVRLWACINFSPYITATIAPQLCNELIEICRTSGMVFEMNPVLTIQCARPEHCNDVSFTDLKWARDADPENNRSFSNMEVVVLNKNIVQDKFEETSNVAGLADEHEERPRLSAISEGIHSATSKSKEIVVGPEAALCEWAIPNEFQDHPTTAEVNESSKGRGLLEMADCVFATANCKMDADGTTETPPKGLGVFLWKAMHDSTLTSLAISVEEVSVKQKTKACYTDQPMNPSMGQTGVFSLWMEEGCWIYYIQDANGRMWERTCRDLQIHHVQPD
jgi:hypothetical protein